MKKKAKITLIIIASIVLLGTIFGAIDYNRIKNNEMPIFMVRISDTSKSNDEYLGIGYRFKRTVGVSFKEPIMEYQEPQFGFWFYTWKISINEKTIDYLYTIETLEKKNCDNKAELYYEKDGRNIYTYCLDSVKINDGKKRTELKNYIENHNRTIEEIINTLTLTTSLFDGGTNIYKDGGTTKFTNNGLTLIKCNTLDGNKDIYIGPKNTEFKENFCKTSNQTFTRTYTIKSIDEYTEQQYEDGTPVTYGNSFKVTLSKFQAETSTIIINNLYDELKVNQTYEFEFMLSNKDITGDIESIFKNSTIVEIRETDKTGLDQVQESIR